MPKTGSVTIVFLPLSPLLLRGREGVLICVLFSFDIRFCIVLKFLNWLAVLRREKRAQETLGGAE
jgi:hypothetical protein